MFKFLLPIAALALSVTAVPQFGPAPTITSAASTSVASAQSTPTTVVIQCNTGDVMCCNSMQSSDNPVIGSLLDMLGIDAGILTANSGQVGIGCTAVGINGTAQGANCAQQPVCCDGNTFNGAINVGCNAVSV